MFERKRAMLGMGCALAAVLCFGAAGAGGATITWTGDGDGTSWWDPNNWSPPQRPGVDDDVLIAQGNVVIRGATISAVARNLTLQTATLRLAGVQGCYAALTVYGNCTNSGTIELSCDYPGSGSTLTLHLGNGTLLNNGVITSDVGAGAPHQITPGSGGLNNQGQINVWHDLSMTGGSGASHVNSGTINLIGGNLTIDLGGTFANSGTIYVGGGRMLVLGPDYYHEDGGSITGTGKVRLYATRVIGPGTFTNPSSLSEMELYLGNNGYIRAPFVNQGLLAAHNYNWIDSAQGTFTNVPCATIRIEAGSSGFLDSQLTVTNGFVNEGKIELINASANNYWAQLSVTNGTLVNAGTIDALAGGGGGLRYLGVAFDNQGQLNIGFATKIEKAGSFSHANSGAINVTGGDLTLALSGDTFTTSGEINIAAGCKLDATLGTFTQTAGSISLNGGTLKSSCLVNIQGGSLVGNGTVNGSIQNSGIVAPGLSPGQISITGNYTQTAAGSLDVELAGSSPGSGFDVLAVSGTATLAGTLSIDVLDPYEPAVGSTFALLTAGTRTGTFSTVDAPCLPHGHRVQVNYQPTSVVLEIVDALKGDMNCDCAVSFADINPFVLALGGQAGYEAAYPNCNWLNGDCNGDGTVNFADINPFVALLSR